MVTLGLHAIKAHGAQSVVNLVSAVKQRVAAATARSRSFETPLVAGSPVATSGLLTGRSLPSGAARTADSLRPWIAGAPGRPRGGVAPGLQILRFTVRAEAPGAGGAGGRSQFGQGSVWPAATR